MMFRRKWNKFVQIANILRVRADEILNFNMDGWMVFLEGKPLTREGIEFPVKVEQICPNCKHMLGATFL